MHKIVLLDKPRENPGELDWSPLQALGETVFYAHTEPEEAAASGTPRSSCSTRPC